MNFNNSKFNQNWNTKKISDMGKFSRGVSKHRPRNDHILFDNGIYPFIQTSEIKKSVLYINNHSATYNDVGLEQSRLWDAGTLCITIAANIAESAILSYPMCFPDSVVSFVADKKKTSEEFVHYVFECMKEAIQSSSQGSTQDNINLEYLESVEFRFPDLNTQNRIVGVLSSIDKKINNNIEIIRECKETCILIYNYWFTQFNYPNSKNKPYRKDGGEFYYNKNLKRNIPIGWNDCKIGAYLHENNKSKVKVENANVDIDKYPFFTSGEDILSYNKKMVSGNNCFLNTGGVADVKYYVGDCSYSTDTWCINFGEYTNYLYLFLDSILPIMDKQFFAGSGLKHLQKEFLKDTQICEPPLEICKKFNNEVDDYFCIISKKMDENRELVSLRKKILPILMNGQLTVEE